MNHYEEKLEARRERLNAAADKADAESQARYAKARDMASAIPFGQPMMVDHYSYKRDRNYRERIHNTYGKSFEAAERAKELRAKAEAVGTAGISSADPSAVEKIQAKLAKHEAIQARMREANAAIRKHAKAGAEAQVAALVALGFDEKQASGLLEPDFCNRVGFADYQLSNNNAEIRRLKKRLLQVAEIQTINAAEPTAKKYGEVEYLEDDGRVQLIFPGKPTEAVRADLKRHGFKWSPTRGAWVRMLTPGAQAIGQRLAEKIASAE